MDFYKYGTEGMRPEEVLILVYFSRHSRAESLYDED